jgi:hypothetical protein
LEDKTVVERVTTVVRGGKPKVVKTTEKVGAWKTILVGRTNSDRENYSTVYFLVEGNKV